MKTYTIKPLKWARYDVGLINFRADTLVGRIDVGEWGGPNAWNWWTAETGYQQCDSELDGKAKAEAWYREQLMKALSPASGNGDARAAGAEGEGAGG